MAALIWRYGVGPTTTEGLADEVEAEGLLVKIALVDFAGRRCLWGVVENAQGYPNIVRRRQLSFESTDLLQRSGLSVSANYLFDGTDVERCQEMARRLRKL
jgi:hypothetical protein